jgi:hypothetical protein
MSISEGGNGLPNAGNSDMNKKAGKVNGQGVSSHFL